MILIQRGYGRFAETLFSDHMHVNEIPFLIINVNFYVDRVILKGGGEDLSTMWTGQEKTLLMPIVLLNTDENHRLFVRNG